jgi:hypothetical protein
LRDNDRVRTVALTLVVPIALGCGSGHGGAGGSGGSAGSGGGGGSTQVQCLQIAVGGDHSCLRANAGDLYCWGRNDSGQVGSGAAGDPVLSPLHITALPGVVDDVALATPAHLRRPARRNRTLLGAQRQRPVRHR